MLLLRGFWKRWTFLLCFFVIVIVVVFQIANREDSIPDDIEDPKFNWLFSNNLTLLNSCRNSKQGPELIADDRGFTCRIEEVLNNGCCNPKGNFTEQFSCMSCQVNRCCKIYENCISCCMQPDKRVPQENKYCDSLYKHCYGIQAPSLVISNG